MALEYNAPYFLEIFFRFQGEVSNAKTGNWTTFQTSSY